MQRYDREREARAYRSGRDNEPRGNYRDDERFQTQGSRQSWRDDDGPGMHYGSQDDGRSSYAGYDEDANFAQQHYGRGRDVGFGRDDDDRPGGSRGTYGAGREYGSASGQYGSPNDEGGRPLYGENSRSGWSNESVRQGYSSERSPYSNSVRSASRNPGYGQPSDYGRDRGPGYGQNPNRGYGQNYEQSSQGYRQPSGQGYGQREMQGGRNRAGWSDYDDSGQGYIGAYGSDLGYGRSSHYGSTNQRSGDSYSQGANYGTGRESAYGRGYDDLSQNHRGRGPKNYTRSDDRIKEDLSERLSDDPYIDAGDINIDVKNGVVTLSGSVDERYLKHRVEDIADNCGGVKDVENKLTVRKAGTGQNLSGSPGGGSTSAGKDNTPGNTNENTKKH
jgi:osmotically-inducible protein OsmY